MKLRNNKVITPHCHYCIQNNYKTRYYPNPKWSSCSRCFKERHPNKWNEFLKKNWCSAYTIPIDDLNKFTQEKAITCKSTINIMKLSIFNADIDTVIKLLHYHLKKDNKWGITAKIAGEMYHHFKNRYSNTHDTGTITGHIDWRVQHLFAGLIVDTWNIKANIHGPIALCYYGNFGNKPRGTIDKLSPCVALKVGNLSGCKYNHSDSYKFWINSIIPIFK